MKKEKLIAFTAILLFILVINISAEENNTDPFELCFSDWVQTDGTYQYGTLAWGSSEEEVEKYLDVTLEQKEVRFTKLIKLIPGRIIRHSWNVISMRKTVSIICNLILKRCRWKKGLHFGNS